MLLSYAWAEDMTFAELFLVPPVKNLVLVEPSLSLSLSSSFEGDSSVCFNPWLCFAPRLTVALTGWFLMKESVIIPQDFPSPWSIISTEFDMSALQTT